MFIRRVISILLLVCAGRSSGLPEMRRWQEGTNQFLECHLHGGANWSGPALADQGERVRIENHGTFSRLHVDDVRAEDSGTYECRHESLVGQFIVTVEVTPRFASQMQEFNVPESGDIQLPCQVEHCPASSCSIYWKRNGNFLSSSEYVSSQEDHTRTQSLNLVGVQQSDAGEYQCIIQPLGTELDFTLNVLSHDQRVPIINKSIEFSYKAIYYTHPLVLQCPVRSGENTTENPLVVRWVYTNIHGEPQHTVGQELRIPGEAYVRGEYRCTASNGVGSDWLDVFVEVQAPPLPASVALPALTATEGDFQAVLEFTPPTSPVAIHKLSYLWEVSREGGWVPLQGDRYTVSVRGHLSMFNLTVSDAGNYRVTISNEFGTSIQTQQVIVNPRPTLAIGFTFELPEMLSCSELQDTSSMLTDYLITYLQSLCPENTTAPSAQSTCSDLELQDVTIDCHASERQGIFNGRLRASRAQSMIARFEENGPTELPGTLNIQPCEAGECVDPTEVAELEDIVIGLVVVVTVLVVAVVAIIILLIYIVKHKDCCSHNCRVADIESQSQLQHYHFKNSSPHTNIPDVPVDPHIPRETNTSEPRYVSGPRQS